MRIKTRSQWNIVTFLIVGGAFTPHLYRLDGLPFYPFLSSYLLTRITIQWIKSRNMMLPDIILYQTNSETEGINDKAAVNFSFIQQTAPFSIPFCQRFNHPRIKFGGMWARKRNLLHQVIRQHIYQLAIAFLFQLWSISILHVLVIINRVNRIQCQFEV